MIIDHDNIHTFSHGYKNIDDTKIDQRALRVSSFIYWKIN